MKAGYLYYGKLDDDSKDYRFLHISDNANNVFIDNLGDLNIFQIRKMEQNPVKIYEVSKFLKNGPYTVSISVKYSHLNNDISGRKAAFKIIVIYEFTNAEINSFKLPDLLTGINIPLKIPNETFARPQISKGVYGMPHENLFIHCWNMWKSGKKILLVYSRPHETYTKDRVNESDISEYAFWNSLSQLLAFLPACVAFKLNIQINCDNFYNAEDSKYLEGVDLLVCADPLIIASDPVTPFDPELASLFDLQLLYADNLPEQTGNEIASLIYQYLKEVNDVARDHEIPGRTDPDDRNLEKSIAACENMIVYRSLFNLLELKAQLSQYKLWVMENPPLEESTDAWVVYYTLYPEILGVQNLKHFHDIYIKTKNEKIIHQLHYLMSERFKSLDIKEYFDWVTELNGINAKAIIKLLEKEAEENIIKQINKLNWFEYINDIIPHESSHRMAHHVIDILLKYPDAIRGYEKEFVMLAKNYPKQDGYSEIIGNWFNKPIEINSFRTLFKDQFIQEYYKTQFTAKELEISDDNAIEWWNLLTDIQCQVSIPPILKKDLVVFTQRYLEKVVKSSILNAEKQFRLITDDETPKGFLSRVDKIVDDHLNNPLIKVIPKKLQIRAEMAILDKIMNAKTGKEFFFYTQLIRNSSEINEILLDATFFDSFVMKSDLKYYKERKWYTRLFKLNKENNAFTKRTMEELIESIGTLFPPVHKVPNTFLFLFIILIGANILLVWTNRKNIFEDRYRGNLPDTVYTSRDVLPSLDSLTGIISNKYFGKYSSDLRIDSLKLNTPFLWRVGRDSTIGIEGIKWSFVFSQRDHEVLFWYSRALQENKDSVVLLSPLKWKWGNDNNRYVDPRNIRLSLIKK